MALFVSPRLRSSRTALCLAVRPRFLTASSKSFLGPLPPPMTREGMVMQSLARRCHLVLPPPARTLLGRHFLCARHSMGGQKIQSITEAGSLNTFGRDEIEVAPISSALLRIACLVILYKNWCVPDQELAADGVSGPV